MFADIQKIENAARMSMGYYDVSPESHVGGLSRRSSRAYWLVGFILVASLLIALFR